MIKLRFTIFSALLGFTLLLVGCGGGGGGETASGGGSSSSLTCYVTINNHSSERVRVTLVSPTSGSFVILAGRDVTVEVQGCTSGSKLTIRVHEINSAGEQIRKEVTISRNLTITVNGITVPLSGNTINLFHGMFF